MYDHLSVQITWDWARRSILLSNQIRLWYFLSYEPILFVNVLHEFVHDMEQ